MKIKNALACIITGMFLLAGCGSVGMMVGGSMKQYSETYEIKSRNPVDVYGELDAIAEKTGFLVSGVDKEHGIASLGKGMSTLGAGMIGSSKTGNIIISGIGSKMLKVYISLQGNFDYGSKKNADKLFDEVASVLQ